ncbi:MAG: hypothetical protein IT548_14380 [Alphaproteobacteria bacterium]|nr:hypothetical protein [Alphaproteobacteria bacterium]
MDTPFLLGSVAAALHVCGYALYLGLAIRKVIEPNAITWLMFAYGTTLLATLEAVSGAAIPELMLPVICATLAVVVAGRCWIVSGFRWDGDWVDTLVFAADVLLTVLFVSVFAWSQWGSLSAEAAALAYVVFLLLSNLTSITSFLPMLRSTWVAPKREDWRPWVCWTFAYLCLGAATSLNDRSDHFWILMLYPASNAIMHGGVALISLLRAGPTPLAATRTPA